ncbi:MAG: DUF362 domain-containing protein [Alphaproteobacteria bacterium]
MKINRRDMLKIMAAAGAATMAPPLADNALAEPRLLVIKGEPGPAVRKIVESFGGMKRFVSNGDRVVIKPNMGFAVPRLRSSNTDHEVIRTVAQMALEAGAKSVQVIDNPVHPPTMCNLRNGIEKYLEDLDDVHYELIRDEKFFAEVEIPNGRQLKRTKVMRPILECDALFNLPMAKSHGGSRVSFSLKNWMGAVKNRGEWHNTFDLHQAIADFATYIKPKLIILDATRALITGGPGGPGEIKNLGTIVGGFDQVAIDSYTVGLSTWNGRTYKPQDIPHIRFAAELGVGSMDVSGAVIKTV